MKPISSIRQRIGMQSDDCNDSNWRLSELIDFEILLESDSRSSCDEERSAADRDIYLTLVEKRGGEAKLSRQETFRAWLNVTKKAKGAETPTTGQKVVSFLKLSGIMLFLVGSMVGLAVLGSVIPPAGSGPVSVLSFFGACVLVPFLLNVCSAYVQLRQQVWPQLPIPRWLIRLADDCLVGMRLLCNWIGRKLSVKVLTESASLKGAVNKHFKRRKDIFASTVFFVLGLFSVGYTTSIWLCSNWQWATKPYEFQWGTTKVSSFTPERVMRGATVVAWPWSSNAERDRGLPTIEQMNATQGSVDRKSSRRSRGHEEMQEAWEAWEGFLEKAVLYYAVCPRVLLVVLAVWGIRRGLANERFTGADRYEELHRRMTRRLTRFRDREKRETPTKRTPVKTAKAQVTAEPVTISTAPRKPQSDPIAQDTDERPLPPTPQPPAPVESETSISESGQLLLLIPDTLTKHVESSRLVKLLTDAYGRNPRPACIIGSKAFVREEFARRYEPELRASLGQIVLVQPSYKAPSKQVVRLLQLIRNLAGSGPNLKVLLIGKPSAGLVFGLSSKESEISMWKKKLDEIADENLGVVSINDLNPDTA